MTPVRWLALFIAIVLGICAWAIAKSAGAVAGVNFRLDIVELPDAGGSVLRESRSIITFDYGTPIVTVYVRQDALFRSGFDS